MSTSSSTQHFQSQPTINDSVLGETYPGKDSMDMKKIENNFNSSTTISSLSPSSSAQEKEQPKEDTNTLTSKEKEGAV